MRTPLFSVIMPLYNHEQYVSEAIQSVFNQTLDNWELIICDDGSSDNSFEVASRYKCDKVKLIHKSRNEGGPDALNSCLLAAKGKYISWLSSDDLFVNTKLQAHAEHFGNRSDLSISVAPFLTMTGEVIEKRKQFIPRTRGEQLTRFLFGNYINGLSVATLRECFIECGGFDKKYNHAGDVHRWFTLFRRFQPAFFHGDGQSISRLNTASQPNSFWGTRFEPVRLLYNDLVRYGLAAFVPHEEWRDKALRFSKIVEVSLLLKHKNSLFTRWGLTDFVDGWLLYWLSKYQIDISKFIQVALLRSEGDEFIHSGFLRLRDTPKGSAYVLHSFLDVMSHVKGKFGSEFDSFLVEYQRYGIM